MSTAEVMNVNADAKIASLEQRIKVLEDLVSNLTGQTRSTIQDLTFMERHVMDINRKMHNKVDKNQLRTYRVGVSRARSEKFYQRPVGPSRNHKRIHIEQLLTESPAKLQRIQEDDATSTSTW